MYTSKYNYIYTEWLFYFPRNLRDNTYGNFEQIPCFQLYYTIFPKCTPCIPYRLGHTVTWTYRRLNFQYTNPHSSKPRSDNKYRHLEKKKIILFSKRNYQSRADARLNGIRDEGLIFKIFTMWSYQMIRYLYNMTRGAERNQN